MYDPDPKENWTQEQHLDILGMLKDLIVGTVNSPHWRCTQHNKNAYLNTGWRIYNDYKRKYIK